MTAKNLFRGHLTSGRDKSWLMLGLYMPKPLQKAEAPKKHFLILKRRSGALVIRTYGNRKGLIWYFGWRHLMYLMTFCWPSKACKNANALKYEIGISRV